MFISIIGIAIIGILVGGFINALADDLPYRRNPGLPTYADGTPRPVIAWLGITAFLSGKRQPTEAQQKATPEEVKEKRLRYYRNDLRLTWRYPATEIVTAALMVLTWVRLQYELPATSNLQLFFWLIFIAIYVLISVIDLEHKLILFIVTIPSILLALVAAGIASNVYIPTFRDALYGGALGFGIFFGVYLGGIVFIYILGKIRGQEINTVAFGFGDVMLATLSGMILGLGATVLAIFIAVFLGALGAFGYMIFRAVLGRRYRMYTALPYGPYIVVGTLILMLYRPETQYALLGYCNPSPPFVC